uniref:Uncharacterized protein n=1 Tax=Cacopsylla melanoneura TaxID=428564 RepID=A0A8D8Z4I2_9HEMI
MEDGISSLRAVFLAIGFVSERKFTLFFFFVEHFLFILQSLVSCGGWSCVLISAKPISISSRASVRCRLQNGQPGSSRHHEHHDLLRMSPIHPMSRMEQGGARIQRSERGVQQLHGGVRGGVERTIS